MELIFLHLYYKSISKFSVTFSFETYRLDKDTVYVEHSTEASMLNGQFGLNMVNTVEI